MPLIKIDKRNSLKTVLGLKSKLYITYISFASYVLHILVNINRNIAFGI